MLVFPNAKINIGLRILRKRRDGFHDIESVFYPVQISDILEILPAAVLVNNKKIEISVSGLKVPASPENLCFKAAQLFQERQRTPKIRIHLHKKIPMESGLGGGSSDAAFTLMVLNDIFDCGLDREVLLHFASEIGSDCSFFIDNLPRLVTGKGNILEPIKINLQGYHLVIVFPTTTVSTAMAYQRVTPSEEGLSLRELPQLKPEQWEGKITNRFEEVVFAMHPEIGRIKESLYGSGAVYASMSGSGSAVYGIFRKDPVLAKDLRAYKIHKEKMV